jgi:hypothetical protein
LLAACRPAPPAAQPIAFDESDSSHVRLLEAAGRRTAGRHVVVLALPDSMSREWQEALTDSLDRGVSELRRIIGAWPWQRIGDRPIRYYLVPERIISHASGTDVVFISMFHVNNGRAPYLHEAGHELLAPPPPFSYDEYPDTVQAEAMFQEMPYWLVEGLPDVLAQMASSAANTREGDVFTIGGLAKADSTCAARVADNPYRADILRTIGGQGAVEALFTSDRIKVAPTFYACAQSMARFVTELIGMERTVALFPAIKRRDWAPVLERAAGMSLADLRARWQARIERAAAP